MSDLDFGNETVQVMSKSGYGYDGGPTMSFPIRHAKDVKEAYNRKDWRELNKLEAVWWDPYMDRWYKFGPCFWDA